MHYIQAENRSQYVLMNRLDDLVKENHYVRLIDIFVDYFIQKDQGIFSFKGAQPIGRKAYAPASLMKLYIYSYLNSISSSRKIEKECIRNIEAIWLMGYLKPDHKTISDFRRENTEGINNIFLSFMNLLKDNGYIKGKTISIDGSKIRANAGMSINLETVSKRLENIEEQLSKYLQLLETTDNIDEEIEESIREKEKISEEIRELKKQKEELQRDKEELERQLAKRISPTDPECRMMKSRQGKHFCYNVQAVVDAENKMIANIEVVSQENDKGQLQPMVEKVEKEIGTRPEEVLADAGYYVMSQIEYLENEKGVNCFVAINHNQEQTKDQRLGINFTYIPEQNVYKCSHNGTLKPKNGLKKDSRRGTLAQAYLGIDCKECKIKPECTESLARTVYRFTNQKWRDEYESKMNSPIGKTKLIQRKTLSEHPFGTIKYWMGHIPLKTRGKVKVKAEINLYSIGYNLKRLINIEGIEKVMNIFKQNELKLA
jgi:transposase